MSLGNDIGFAVACFAGCLVAGVLLFVGAVAGTAILPNAFSISPIRGVRLTLAENLYALIFLSRAGISPLRATFAVNEASFRASFTPSILGVKLRFAFTVSTALVFALPFAPGFSCATTGIVTGFILARFFASISVFILRLAGTSTLASASFAFKAAISGISETFMSMGLLVMFVMNVPNVSMTFAVLLWVRAAPFLAASVTTVSVVLPLALVPTPFPFFLSSVTTSALITGFMASISVFNFSILTGLTLTLASNGFLRSSSTIERSGTNLTLAENSLPIRESASTFRFSMGTFLFISDMVCTPYLADIIHSLWAVFQVLSWLCWFFRILSLLFLLFSKNGSVALYGAAREALIFFCISLMVFIDGRISGLFTSSISGL